ncbi:MAG: DNA-formamidopyrimidine glycosylase family protein, partial [Dehalococcoidia bacterium]|nr:DNA-formamidopyrimidine glycosylase family protein [Dehalococcoidia bacterium]
MPELPEVETVMRDLTSQVVGRAFQRVVIHWPGVVEQPTSEEFISSLAGQRIERLSRRGKYILFHLSSGCNLIFHLRMTGRLYLSHPGAAPDRYGRASFFLEEGQELRFADIRKFGRI